MGLPGEGAPGRAVPGGDSLAGVGEEGSLGQEGLGRAQGSRPRGPFWLQVQLPPDPSQELVCSEDQPAGPPLWTGH